MPLATKSLRFGVFELDPVAGELRKNGLKLKLQGQPLQVLESLLEHQGKVVTREELRQRLWPSDTFVDFEHNLNSAVKRLREALGDSADNPRFIETLPRHGYRFIASLPEQPEAVAHRSHSSHIWLIALAALVLLVGAAGLAVYFMLRRAPMPFQNFSIAQITHTGKAARAAISPDGRYVVSVMDDNGLESMWLRNTPTGSDTQVIPPSFSHYESLAFSPDGNYFYFRTAQNATRSVYYVYRSPILGGTPQKIAEDVSGDFALSSDGRHIAYMRWNNPEVGKYRMLTAGPQGENERVLEIGSLSTRVPFSLAWSPEGDEISYLFDFSTINVLNTRSGKSRRLATFKDDKLASKTQWSTKGNVFVIYRKPGTNWARGQIGVWRGEGADIDPITRDTNSYSTLTLTADGKTISTVMARSYATISMLTKAGGGFVDSRPLLSQSNEFDIWSALRWSADGDLLLSNTGRLMKLAANGKNRSELLADSSATLITPSSCGGSYLVLSWSFHGGTTSQSIWRTNADGSSPLELTFGNTGDFAPVCSPDQRWVYYVEGKDNRICRVPIDGSGKAEPAFSLPADYVLYKNLDALGISPDGKILAIPVGDNTKPVPVQATKIALFELNSQGLPRMLDPTRYSTGMQFTPDGKSVAYVSREKNVDNIWVQPTDGSPGHPVTHFTSEQIWSFRLSPDGKRLAVLRGHWDSDVILLQDSK